MAEDQILVAPPDPAATIRPEPPPWYRISSPPLWTRKAAPCPAKPTGHRRITTPAARIGPIGRAMSRDHVRGQIKDQSFDSMAAPAIQAFDAICATIASLIRPERSRRPA